MFGLLGYESSRPAARTSLTSVKNTATACCVPASSTKVVLIPLPPSVGQAIDHDRPCTGGPILVNSRGARIDRHQAPRTWPFGPQVKVVWLDYVG